MVGVVCPVCRGDTLWRYPTIPWAMNHVPEYPPVNFRLVPVWDKKHQPRPLMGLLPCDDPLGHYEEFKRR